MDVEHYFWVRPVDDPCGECFDTLEEAIAEAQQEMELEAVHAVNGPVQVVEVRGSDERLVWRLRRKTNCGRLPKQAPAFVSPSKGIRLVPGSLVEQRLFAGFIPTRIRALSAA